MNAIKDFSILKSEATFSSCGLYRWHLKRTFLRNKRTLLFIGLNPSTATAINDDQTMKRLSRFSLKWGYGNLVVINLFARIGNSPVILRKCSNPIGDENDKELCLNALQWSESNIWDLWLGWGAGGVLKERNLEVMTLLKGYCINRAKNFPNAMGPLTLGLTRKGHPRHPLYSASKEVLKPFNFL